MLPYSFRRLYVSSSELLVKTFLTWNLLSRKALKYKSVYNLAIFPTKKSVAVRFNPNILSQRASGSLRSMRNSRNIYLILILIRLWTLCSQVSCSFTQVPHQKARSAGVEIFWSFLSRIHQTIDFLIGRDCRSSDMPRRRRIILVRNPCSLPCLYRELSLYSCCM